MNTLFFRLLDSEDKAAALSGAVDAVREGRLLNAVVHAVDPASFRQVPGSPFAYWVSDRVRVLFCELSLIRDRYLVASGTGTLDDLRFLRLWFEISTCHVSSSNAWFPFAKGGTYSPYYFDHHLVVNWQNDGAEMKAWIVVQVWWRALGSKHSVDRTLLSSWSHLAPPYSKRPCAPRAAIRLYICRQGASRVRRR